MTPRHTDLEETLAFEIHSIGLPDPQREFKFHPTRKWRFDFCWPEHMLAAEVEGGIYSGGRHVRGAGYAEDCVKYNEAALLGWRVLRFTGSMINSGEALDYIEMGLQNGRK